MGRSKSRSRTRSPKHKRDRDYSNSSPSRSPKRKFVKEKKETKLNYNFSAKSDFKYHAVFENVKVRNKKDEGDVMDVVEKVLKDEFGPIDNLAKTQEGDNSFSFAVGFRYDRDAYNCLKEDGYITSIVDNSKLICKPTPVFEYCLPLIKEARKNQKLENPEKERFEKEKREKKPKKHDSREKSPKRRRHSHSRSSSNDRSHKKKDDRKRSHERDRRDNKDKAVWIFGLPWSIKGKEVQSYLTNHSSGPFPVVSWKWIRIKDSNCEFMQVVLEQKKASKLLQLREQLQIEGCPCIITSAANSNSTETLKQCLREFQFKVTLPDKIYPDHLYKALNDSARVVQLVSTLKSPDGRSDSFIVTLGSSAKAKDIKRLNQLVTGIKIEDVKGQLVYRPTKQTKLNLD